MTGKVYNIEPVSSGLRMQDGVRQYWSPFFQKWITKKTASSNGGTTYLRAWNQINFANRVARIKQLCAEEQTSAEELAVNTPFLKRDLLMKAQTGNLYTISADDGLTWIGRSVLEPNAQQLLDSIASDVGSILVRSPLGWLGLKIGDAHQVLTVDGTGDLPEWQDPSSGGGSTPEFQLITPAESSFGENYACAGSIIVPAFGITMQKLGMVMTTVTGGTYRMGIAPYDKSTNEMTGVATYSGIYTEAAGAANKPLIFDLSMPLTAGQAYIVFINRNDGAGTISQTFNAPSGTVPLVGAGLYLPATSGVTCRLCNQVNPGVGDAWASGGSGQWSLQFFYKET